jgi:transcription initiation factor IIE alpha subunit
VELYGNGDYLCKMAEVGYHCSTGAPVSGFSRAQELTCKYCNEHLSEIASLNTELQSARKIIQLLQEGLNGIKNQSPEGTSLHPK